jgi:hypothetical protein
MPTRPHPNSLHRKLVLDGTVPQHRRIYSLGWLGRHASLALLKKVFQSPNSPGRLKALALEMYTNRSIEIYLAKQEAAKEQNEL